MLGPVFSREIVIAPRRNRLYLLRSIYPLGLLALISTAWMVLYGSQILRNVGDFARFGALLFQLLASLQLALAVFFSALLTAGAVSQEKDRRTLVLLLLTRMNNPELVLGKLAASLLAVVTLLLAAAPVLTSIALFGGVSFAQIGRTYAVTLLASVAAGSLGSTIALSRDKTFQTLALTAIVTAAWLGAGEVLAAGVFDRWAPGVSNYAVAISPWRALAAASQPDLVGGSWAARPEVGFLIFAAALTVSTGRLGRISGPDLEWR